jgi:hypothetical protein
MAHIVAADFNPPINNNDYLLSSVGTVHLRAIYMHHPYGIQKKWLIYLPWIEIHGYNMSHSYGIFKTRFYLFHIPYVEKNQCESVVSA